MQRYLTAALILLSTSLLTPFANAQTYDDFGPLELMRYRAEQRIAARNKGALRGPEYSKDEQQSFDTPKAGTTHLDVPSPLTTSEPTAPVTTLSKPSTGWPTFIRQSNSLKFTPTKSQTLAQRAYDIQLQNSRDSKAKLSNPYRALMEIVLTSSNSGQTKQFNHSLRTLKQTHPDKAELFEAFFNLRNVNSSRYVISNSFSKLQKTNDTHNRDVDFLRNLLLSAYHLQDGDVLMGLQKSDIALNIAAEIHEKTPNYQNLYDIHRVINIGLILDKSRDQAIENTEKMLDYAMRSGLTPDAISIANNLAVLHSYRGDNHIALNILSIAEDNITTASPEQKVTLAYTLAFFLIQEKSYKDAQYYLEYALETNPPKELIPHIYSKLALILSHNGSMVEAKLLLKKIEETKTTASSRLELEQATLTLKTLIAEKEGDYLTALNSYRTQSEIKIKKLSDEVSENRRNANLKILQSSHVTSQRLKNLEVEASLKDSIIAKEKRSKNFLMIIILLVIALTIIALAWLSRSKKINKKLNIAMRKAVQGEEAKTRFLAMMSHEVRTPLNTIIPLSEQLKIQTQSQGSKSMLGIIQSSGEALLRMMDNIMTLSDDSAQLDHSFDKTSIKEIIDRAIETTENIPNQKKFKIDVIYRNGHLPLKTDHRKLERALINLLSNAVKFDEKGEVLVIVGQVASTIKITIIDHGIGFDMSTLPSLLTPFVQADDSITRSHGGAGIGLPATQKLVDQLKGTLEISSVPNSGTTATIKIPHHVPEINLPVIPSERKAA